MSSGRRCRCGAGIRGAAVPGRGQAVTAAAAVEEEEEMEMEMVPRVLSVHGDLREERRCSGNSGGAGAGTLRSASSRSPGRGCSGGGRGAVPSLGALGH